MHSPELERRSFLLGLGGLGVGHVVPQSATPAPSAPSQGYVLAPSDGEHLIHFRDLGNIFIKASSATGSNSFSFGTQQVTLGTGIPVHRHFHMDEAFYILDGKGVFTLNDVPHPFEKGATIFIPKNSWHGFTNPDHELLLLWIVSPSGLDGFFRETCNPPGVPPKQFTREQLNAIARKYATEFR
jgi:quercetin dioxygenase-like cupin family protein